MSTDLTTTTTPHAGLATAPTIGELQERLRKAKEFLETALVPARLTGPYAQRQDGDYGVIPGCGDKPVLFKSGAEKLARLFDVSVTRLERTLFERIDARHEFGEAPGFMVAYACDISGPDGRVWGSAEAFTSHDESTFHEYTYEGQYPNRNKVGFKAFAPLNTLAARAQKRAYVRALVQALGITSLVSTHDGAATSDLLTETQRDIVLAVYEVGAPRMLELARRQAVKVKQAAWPAFLGAALDTVAEVRGWSDEQRARAELLLDDDLATRDTVVGLLADGEVVEGVEVAAS